MVATFKATMMKEWTLDEDKIYVGKDIIYLSTLTDARYIPTTSSFKNGVVQIFIGSKFYTLAFPYKQAEDGDKAARIIMAAVGK